MLSECDEVIKAKGIVALRSWEILTSYIRVSSSATLMESIREDLSSMVPLIYIGNFVVSPLVA